MRSFFLLALAVLTAAPAQEVPPRLGPEDPARAALAAALAESGVLLDFEAGAAAIDVSVLVKEDLLEYLLVGPGGAGHEALFQTAVQPSLLNAGLLALGVEPGVNARWERTDPPPTLEERRAGKKAFKIHAPTGDGFYPYVTWREADEVFFYRVEDLIANLRTGRAMQRHRWVYLGSAFLPPEHEGEPPLFAADAEANLINLAYFQAGHTLLTAALDDCEDQSIWVGNPWLLPRRGTTVRFVLARTPLSAAPAAWATSLPVVAPGEAADAPDTTGAPAEHETTGAQGAGLEDGSGERDDG
jgi:hypothetical protein